MSSCRATNAKDATYAQLARDRLAAAEDGLSLRDARAGQLPMFPGGAL